MVFHQLEYLEDSTLKYSIEYVKYILKHYFFGYYYVPYASLLSSMIFACDGAITFWVE